MAFISQEEKKIVLGQIKPILTKYGLKGTLSVSHRSKLVLTISCGKIDFITNYNEGTERNDRYLAKRDYIEVNEYHYKNVLTGNALNALVELFSAMRMPGWKEESDIMSDYFNISYYISLTIGTYNKPYRVIP